MAAFEADQMVAQIDGLRFSFPQRDLFTDWSARFPEGLSCVLGDEGSGKTSLMRLLAVVVRGRRVGATPPAGFDSGAIGGVEHAR